MPGYNLAFSRIRQQQHKFQGGFKLVQDMSPLIRLEL